MIIQLLGYALFGFIMATICGLIFDAGYSIYCAVRGRDIKRNTEESDYE